MFTGIIEATGLITRISNTGTNRRFIIESSLAPQLKVDQSLAHNGVCLTVESANDITHEVTAVQETLSKTTLGRWEKGQLINLEQSLQWNGRFDGHFVQGHVDARGICIKRTSMNGSWEYRISYPEKFANLIIEKGSINVDGVSLTVFNVTETEFSVAIIPFTFDHTNLKLLNPEMEVNLEFDMIGKYVIRSLEVTKKSS